MMSLSERKKEILRAVVELYVKGAEPVGSKAVANALESPVSSATIRSEMADLESMGLLEQPHTSAGRIPSSIGYRTYVNELMQNQNISSNDAEVIDSELDGHLDRPTNLLDKVGNLTSRLTTYPAYAMASATGVVCIARFDLIYVDSSTFIIVALLSNDTVKNKLVHLTTNIEPPMLTKLSAVLNASFAGISEERITPALIAATERAVGDTNGVVAVVAGFTIELLVESKSVGTHISGAVNLLSHPEFRDVDKAQRIIRYLTDEKELARLPSPDSPGELKITIGPENLANELRDSSVMAIKYDAGNDIQGLIGVVGPTRMDYSKVAAHLSYMAQGLSLLLGGLSGDLLKLNAPTKANMLGDNEIGEE